MRPFIYCRVNPVTQNTNANANSPPHPSPLPQVVFNDPAHCPRDLMVGASVRLSGKVAASPRAEHQAIELHVSSEDGVEVLGTCPGESYPLGGKSHSLEYLREQLHLRPRTTTISAVLRVRSALTRALHGYFDRNHFFQVHTHSSPQTIARVAGKRSTSLLLGTKQRTRLHPTAPQHSFSAALRT